MGKGDESARSADTAHGDDAAGRTAPPRRDDETARDTGALPRAAAVRRGSHRRAGLARRVRGAGRTCAPETDCARPVLIGDAVIDRGTRRVTLAVGPLRLTATEDRPLHVRPRDAGAADYTVKLFSPAELAARVALVLRRRTAPGSRSPGARCHFALSLEASRSESANDDAEHGIGLRATAKW